MSLLFDPVSAVFRFVAASEVLAFFCQNKYKKRKSRKFSLKISLFR